MTEEKTPIITLENICTEPTFLIEDKKVRFGLTDFEGHKGSERKSGFYVQQNDNITAISLQELPIYHELHLQQGSAQYIQSMQIYQNMNKPTEFNIIMGAMSGCCDGAVLGGTYFAEDNSFEVVFATRVPFNTYAIVGHMNFSAEDQFKSGNIFAAGSGCDGAGVQYLAVHRYNTNQEYIFNLHDIKVDSKIAKYKPSYESFQYQNVLRIENDALTVAGINMEEAFKSSQNYYQHKELFEKEQNDDKKRTHEYTIKGIEERLAKIRFAAFNSKFMSRNRYEVYP